MKRGDGSEENEEEMKEWVCVWEREREREVFSSNGHTQRKSEERESVWLGTQQEERKCCVKSNYKIVMNTTVINIIFALIKILL